jgi:hypothetical protein
LRKAVVENILLKKKTNCQGGLLAKLQKLPKRIHFILLNENYKIENERSKCPESYPVAELL